jgi:hypothetical protein
LGVLLLLLLLVVVLTAAAATSSLAAPKALLSTDATAHSHSSRLTGCAVASPGCSTSLPALLLVLLLLLLLEGAELKKGCTAVRKAPLTVCCHRCAVACSP